MKGLLMKDLKMMLVNKAMLSVIIVMTILFYFTGSEGSGNFVVVYVTLMSSMMGISIMSMEEKDHSSAFIMCLPVNKTTIVKEKYLFAHLMTIIGWSLIVFVNLIDMQNGKKEFLLESSGGLFGMLLVQLILIPMFLKYGLEKARIVLFIIAFGIAGSVVAIMQLGSESEMPEIIQQMILQIQQRGIGELLLCLIVVYGILLLCSIGCSNHIMEKKEF